VGAEESNLRRARRPTPREKVAAWADWSAAETARQAREKEDGQREAYERARAEHAGRPWPPEPTA
jgi:hypothetical protein